MAKRHSKKSGGHVKVDRCTAPRLVATAQAIQHALHHHQSGRFAEAETAYKKVLAAEPDNFDALHLLGVLAYQQGSNVTAVEYFSKALRSNDKDASVYSNLGVALKALGRLNEAEAAYRQALQLRPDYAEAYNNLGNILNAGDQFSDAMTACRQAIALKPDYAEAYNNLGNALQSLGRLDEAETAHRQAITLKPDYAEAYNNLGNALQSLGRLDEAEAAHRQAITLKPDYAEAYNNLGNALQSLGRLDEAETAHRQAITLKPDYAEAYNNLGSTLNDLGRLAESEAAYHRAIALRLNFAEAYNNLGNALQSLGRMDEAERSHRQAITLKPDYAEAYSNLGSMLQELGRMDEAEAGCRLALSLKRDFADAYFNLSAVKKFKKNDADLRAIEALLQQTGISANNLMKLHYAAGKGYSDIGDNAECAFSHYAQGAYLKRKGIEYDISADEILFSTTAAIFTAKRLELLCGSGCPTPAPVFIVGMPRSGTTLTEQILASHPDMYGAGERKDLIRIVNSVSLGKRERFPQWVDSVTPEELLQIGQTYHEQVIAKVPVAALRVTDKMPANFLYLGLIVAALPNARIIHVRRNPVDTCLSCFTQLFTEGQHYSYNLNELGRYYRAYERLMEHWRQVLPQGIMLEVQYEDLVENLEEESRKLVAHCGLEWESACLEFHKTDRPVQTASATQVRQPIYKSSVEKWRTYEPWLGELLEVLRK